MVRQAAGQGEPSPYLDRDGRRTNGLRVGRRYTQSLRTGDNPAAQEPGPGLALLEGSQMTFDWQAKYASKLATAAEAIRLIPRGRRILIGSGAAEPLNLVQALVRHGEHLADNEVVHLLTLGP